MRLDGACVCHASAPPFHFMKKLTQRLGNAAAGTFHAGTRSTTEKASESLRSESTSLNLRSDHQDDV